MNKIKVLLHYLIYPLAMATYFKKALQHRSDVDLKICGPYTGQWIPWTDANNPNGMTLPKKYDFPPDVPVPFRPDVGEYNYEIVKSQLGDWKPDLIIQVDAGMHFKYKPSDGMVVTIGTDPHVLNDWYDIPRKYSDKFFNMQAAYSKANDVYLPYAYSQYDFYPEDVNYGEKYFDNGKVGTTMSLNYKDLDAVLVGNIYAERVEWVRKLRERGVKVEHQLGVVFDEARTLYNRGKIGLNWSTLNDLNCRAFELPAMKLAPVMNLVPDIGRFFTQGEDYLGFTSLSEAVERVVWLRDNPVRCKEIAEHAYQTVLPHTYDARVEQILKECGFIS